MMMMMVMMTGMMMMMMASGLTAVPHSCPSQSPFTEAIKPLSFQTGSISRCHLTKISSKLSQIILKSAISPKSAQKRLKLVQNQPSSQTIPKSAISLKSAQNRLK